MTILVLKSGRTKMILAMKMIEQLGNKRVVLRNDSGPAILALKGTVRKCQE